jgi:hypothetical protein
MIAEGTSTSRWMSSRRHDARLVRRGSVSTSSRASARGIRCLGHAPEPLHIQPGRFPDMLATWLGRWQLENALWLTVSHACVAGAGVSEFATCLNRGTSKARLCCVRPMTSLYYADGSGTPDLSNDC